jgi:hypothetical protein
MIKMSNPTFVTSIDYEKKEECPFTTLNGGI